MYKAMQDLAVFISAIPRATPINTAVVTRSTRLINLLAASSADSLPKMATTTSNKNTT